MPLIRIWPADGPATTGTPATNGTVDSGCEAAWAQIHELGSWAQIPKPTSPDEHAEYRSRSAWLAYGIHPFAVTTPHADPLSIRIRLSRFADPEADRRANIRLLARDVAGADPARTGIRAARARERLRWQAKSRPADVAAAHQVVAHFDALAAGVRKRIPAWALGGDVLGPVAIGIVASFPAMALAPQGPNFRLWQLGLAALVAMVCAFHVGLTKGWKLGYDQAVWHCAEAGVDTAGVVAERTKKAAEEARHRAARRMAFKLPRQPRNEGYLYVVEFSTGTVKVGQTEDPQVRLGAHRREAEAFGVHVANYWISPAHINFLDNETRLINRCTKVSNRSRKEYFHQLGYGRARQFVSELSFYSDNAEQVSVEGVWA